MSAAATSLCLSARTFHLREGPTERATCKYRTWASQAGGHCTRPRQALAACICMYLLACRHRARYGAAGCIFLASAHARRNRMRASPHRLDMWVVPSKLRSLRGAATPPRPAGPPSCCRSGVSARAQRRGREEKRRGACTHSPTHLRRSLPSCVSPHHSPSMSPAAASFFGRWARVCMYVSFFSSSRFLSCSAALFRAHCPQAHTCMCPARN